MKTLYRFYQANKKISEIYTLRGISQLTKAETPSTFFLKAKPTL